MEHEADEVKDAVAEGPQLKGKKRTLGGKLAAKARKKQKVEEPTTEEAPEGGSDEPEQQYADRGPQDDDEVLQLEEENDRMANRLRTMADRTIHSISEMG